MAVQIFGGETCPLLLCVALPLTCKVDNKRCVYTQLDMERISNEKEAEASRELEKKMKPTGSNWRCVLLEELSPRQTSELNLAREQAIRAAAEREVSSLKAEQDVLNLKLRLGAEKGMDAVNLKVS